MILLLFYISSEISLLLILSFGISLFDVSFKNTYLTFLNTYIATVLKYIPILLLFIHTAFIFNIITK